MAALAAPRLTLGRVRLHRRHVDGEGRLLLSGCLGLVRRASNAVERHVLAITTDHRVRHLATRHQRRDAALAVHPEHRFLPTQVGARLEHLTRAGPPQRSQSRLGGLSVGGALGPRRHPVGIAVGVPLGVVAVVHLHMTAVALRHPRSVAGVAFQLLRMRLHTRHRHGGGGTLPRPALVQRLEHRDLEVVPGGRVEQHLVAALHHVAEGIAARRQQIAVAGLVDRRHLRLGQQLIRQAACLPAQTSIELLAVPDGQLPRESFRRSVAVRALDLHLRQRGAEDVAVPVHVDGGVTVLAQ